MKAQTSILLLSIVWAQPGPAQKAGPPPNPPGQKAAGSRPAPAHILRGLVLNLENGSSDPVGNVGLLIVTTNSHTSTNSDGLFLISLPDVMPGEAIQVSIAAAAGGKEIRLFQPLDGRVRIPADLSKEVVTIGVLPKGSRRFLTDEAIESLIRYANAQGQQETMNRPAQVGQFDLGYFLEHWGKDQGLDPAEVAERVRAWAEGIGSKPMASLEQRALAEFTRHNFEDAGRMFSQAGDDRMQRLAQRREREKEEEEEETRLAIEDYTQSGNAMYNGNHCVQAAGKFEKAMSLTSVERNAGQWFGLKVRQGNSYECANSEEEVAGGAPLLDEAVADFQEALNIPGATSHPDVLAIAQTGLAKTLADQSESKQGADGAALLDKSLALMQSTIEIYKLAGDREEIADLQSDIAKVYGMQAERTQASEELDLLHKSDAAYKESLVYYTEKDFPQQWASIQVSRCANLRVEAKLEPQKQQDLLEDSSQVCRQAIESFGDKHDKEWAIGEAALGMVLFEQADSEAKDLKSERLNKALDAYQKALTVLTRRDFPPLWASVLANMGNALKRKADQTSGEQRKELFQSSHGAYMSALEVISVQERPGDWATVQSDLGNLLQLQALDAEGDEALGLIHQAVDAYRDELTVRTRKEYPEQWARAQNLIGLALYQQGLAQPPDKAVATLSQSADAYRNALDILNQKDFKDDWASIEKNLGNVLLKQAKELEDQTARAKALSGALDAFQKSLVISDPEHNPEDWAAGKVSIGDVFQQQGDPPGGKPDAATLDKSLAAYHDALKVYTRQQFPDEWASAQVQIAGALQAQSEAAQGEAARALLAKAIQAYEDGIEAYPKDSAQSRAQAQFLLGVALINQAAGSNPGEAHEQYRRASQAVSSFLQVYPDMPQIMVIEEGVLHDHLFEFEAAFAINERRVKKLPDDLDAEADFIEKHLTTGRYAGCVDRSQQLAARLPADSTLWIPVSTIQGVCELGAGHREQAISALTAVEQKLKTLAALTWTFDGTKHFIEVDSAFAPYRDPILQFLAAIEGRNLDSFQAALRALLASINRPTPTRT